MNDKGKIREEEVEKGKEGMTIGKQEKKNRERKRNKKAKEGI